jgi:alpha-1,2-mannosyltransferase
MRSWVADRRVLAFIVLVGLAIYNLRISVGAAGKFILVHPGFSDFASYYIYAQVGLHQGWNHLYDLAAQRQEWFRLGGPDAIPWFAMLYPPPLAWLVAPLAVLPYPVAFGCWTALLIGLTLAAWRLVAPRTSRLARWTALAAMLAVFPIVYGIILGQVVIVELAAIAAFWWLLSRGREIPAGVLLVALLFKPHLAILVPIVLLLIGRWRTVLAGGISVALIAVVAIATTGIDGLRAYAERLSDPAAVAQQFGADQFTLVAVLGSGPVTVGASAVMVALTLVTVYRNRAGGVTIPLASALIGSMLIAPYLHWQDLATLLLAGGIALHGRLDRWTQGSLVAGYAVVLGMYYWGTAVLGPLLLVTEVAVLVSLVLRPASAGESHATDLPDRRPLARPA